MMISTFRGKYWLHLAHHVQKTFKYPKIIFLWSLFDHLNYVGRNETCRTENNLIHSMFKSCSDGLKIIVASDAQPNSLILDMNISLNFFLVFSSKNFLETLTMSDGIFFCLFFYVSGNNTPENILARNNAFIVSVKFEFYVQRYITRNNHWW